MLKGAEGRFCNLLAVVQVGDCCVDVFGDVAPICLVEGLQLVFGELVHFWASGRLGRGVGILVQVLVNGMLMLVVMVVVFVVVLRRT